MIKRYQKLNYVIYFTIIWTGCSFAEETWFHPYVETGVLYTDDVYQSAENNKSSVVSSIEAGMYSQLIRNDASFIFNYDIEQLLYSHSSDENDTYQSLLLFADKKVANTGLKVDATATILNIAESNDNNANANIISNNTVESKNAEIGLSFTTNPRKDIDLNVRGYGIITDNEDDIGNYKGYGTTLNFSNGLNQKQLFWESNALYDKKTDRQDDTVTERSYFKGSLGFQTISKISPLVRMNYENYEGVSYQDTEETFSWGPGVRYFLTQNSFFELSYNFVEKGDISNFVGGRFKLEPSPRLLINFSYDKRYFGDAYDFTLIHRSRRTVNTISYTEATNNFQREFYSSDEDIEVFTLNRRLEWLTELTGRRETYGFKLFYHEQEPLKGNSSRQDETGIGATLLSSYELSRKLELSGEISYSQYRFNRTVDQNQEDDYWYFVLSSSYKIYRNVFSTVKYVHDSRKSNINSRDYDENRISLDVRMEW
ncbi:TIGR03016 family PEP-CTERM system-associated outer membrane protein [Photobacterium lutimaris]|nr:TIGR03016 family PEP-CTERM system-associated outer membrane protein [Photobacterium lutimaris]TDR78643.1 uncharacterized protein (PEP-CTERM system associated) [Photobacterium lutimaris]